MLLSCVVYITSCDDILEKDISSKTLTLIAPGDSVVSGTNEINFLWDHVDGATHYRLQIVEGNFDSPDFLVLDTVMLNNHFEYTLDSGSYEWGVSAGNSEYSTLFFKRSLTVGEDTDSGGDLMLQFPEDGEILNDSIVQFRWKALAGADNYVLTINPDTPLKRLASSNTLTISLANIDSTYKWQVVGVNSANGSNVQSEIYQFSIDVD